MLQVLIQDRLDLRGLLHIPQQGRQVQDLLWQGRLVQGLLWRGRQVQGLRGLLHIPQQGRRVQGLLWQGRLVQGLLWQGLLVQGLQTEVLPAAQLPQANLQRSFIRWQGLGLLLCR